MEKRVLFLFGALGVVGAFYLFSRTETGALAIANMTDRIAGGIRRNNPGNIDWIENPDKRWNGMIAREGRFGVFDTPANGIRAIGGELRASIKKRQTIEQAIYEWAPPNENNTDAYLRHVENFTGFDRKMMLAAHMIPSISEVIILHENGVQPYARADIARWSQMS